MGHEFVSPIRRMRAISSEEADKIPTNITTTGPLKVKDPAYHGDTDYLCPSCGAVLVEKTNAVGIATIPRLDCYKCTLSTTGLELAE